MPHGGAREGSGRKLIGAEKRKTVAVCLPPEQIALLDSVAARRGVSRSQVLVTLLESFALLQGERH